MAARTGALIFLTAQRFISKITLTTGTQSVDAKSPIGVLSLGQHRPKLPDGSYNFGPDAGTPMTLSVEGPDAAAAFETMADLFTCGERVVQCRGDACLSTAILLSVNPGWVEYGCSNGHSWAVNRKTGKPSATFFLPFGRK